MIDDLLVPEIQEISLYTNKKTTPSWDGCMNIQIKRPFFLICNYFITYSLL